MPRTGRTGLSLLAMAAAAAWAPVWAQETPNATPKAQDAADSARTPEAAPVLRRKYFIEPFASLTETLTDNGNLTTDRQPDLINEASVGLRASANTARLKGYLDYSLRGLVYTKGTADNQIQNSLAAFGTAELLESRIFVDVEAGISQQLISAFGTQSPDSALGNANRTEVANYALSPYVRGRLGAAAQYELRLRYASTHSSHSSSFDNDTASGEAQFSGLTTLTPLTWSAQLSHTIIDYTAGRRTEADLARGVLTWAVTPQLKVSAIGGAESNNYLSLDKQSHSDYGIGVEWRPSERTKLSAQRENRFFGDSHAVSFVHRTARTIWTYTDSRGIMTTPNQSSIGSLGTAFDLFFEQFAPREPDPIARRQLVNAFLQLNLIDPNRQLLPTFLTSAATVERTQNLSFALLGLRDTLTVSASQGRTSRLDVLVIDGGDFSTADEIVQRGISIHLAHRLTPLATLSFGGLYQRVTGSPIGETTLLRSLTALWSTQLGRRTHLSLGARRSHFTSVTLPYDESAVYASVRLTF
jgi:uncharacterized protein (PEP-CTERM system associated)